jgi:hypothetical protein
VGRGRLQVDRLVRLACTDNPPRLRQQANAGEFTQDDFAIDRLNAPGSISHLTTTAGVEAAPHVFGKIECREGTSLGGRAARPRPGSSAGFAFA